ncbi:hypothetical protein [Luteimonas abyssi]|uniref:hypothetical protein n=1 Tax=Luteimonas abyssi TaxID=1247514 RepID=UPI0009EA884F|nr:hypothetical protein [Luteimonas abyssi]
MKRSPTGAFARLVLSLLLAIGLAACAASPGQTDAQPTADAPAPTEPAVPVDLGPAPVSAGAGQLPDLDTSCRIDSDCVVKDVGNCCGTFPACVNRDSPADPQAVMAECERSGMASVCGFREIQACTCVQQRCEAADASRPVTH